MPERDAATGSITTSDYNDLKASLARRDVVREIAALALADRMGEVVARLVDCDVLPPGTRAQRPSILHAD